MASVDAEATPSPQVGPPNTVLQGVASNSTVADTWPLSCFDATPSSPGGCSAGIQGSSRFVDIATVSPAWTTSSTLWPSTWTYPALATKVQHVLVSYCFGPKSCVVIGRPTPPAQSATLQTDIIKNGVETDSTPQLAVSYNHAALKATNIYPTSLTCADLLDCVAPGFAQLTTGPQIGFEPIIVTEVAGLWSIALLDPGAAYTPPPYDNGSYPFLTGILGEASPPSCASASFCVAVSVPQVTSDGSTQNFLSLDVNGTLSQVYVTPSDFSADMTWQDVACWSANRCLAVGSYEAGDGDFHAAYATDVNGTWSAHRLLALDPLSASASELASVGCASSGSCWAGGDYNVAGIATPFVVPISTVGTVGNVNALSVPSGTTAAMVDEVACPTATSCVAAGGYSSNPKPPGTYSTFNSKGLIATLGGGKWTTLTEENGTTLATPLDLSCSAAGYCAASAGPSIVAINLESSALPGAPTALKFAATKTAITISWKAPPPSGAPLETYEYSTNNGRSWRLTNATTTRQKITGLSKNLIYRVRVRAFNGLGVGASSKFINVKLKVSSGSS